MVAERRRQAGDALAATDDVTVRFASRDDAQGLRRLAEIDSGTAPAGPALVAEVDGLLVAALPLGGGEPLSDPFRPTADVVRLLELREAQLRGRGRRRRGAARRPAQRIQTTRQGGIPAPDRR